ncbi:3-oxoacyl-[acyl-carrier protein] reductase [Planomicrobium koreense]|uniref:3-oxoacyl-[acyl-carrier protein] reductase n=1 Tax=Planococcus koreensis TaxID=112331 RepID=A0A7W8FTK6_9BACL|nr:3-ketoacyl-ACP reductase [Planococcus koreensis]MBB5181163.1 3-oxoacyl-[acyl-carrier protein] reductase [Planococcus koreensis]
MAQSLSGKIAFITGAGKGIGRASALALAKEGVHIGLIARTEEDLKKTAAEAAAQGVKTAYALADVSDLGQVEQAIAKLTQELGAADILINNAGIGKFGPLLEIAPEDWKQVIDVNLMGMFYVTRTVLPQLIEKNGGDIVNISSMSGLKGGAGSSAYSASKFGVLGLTESLSQEVRKHNIRVFALTPSRVITDFGGSSQKPADSDEKFMQPEDIAEYIVAQLKLHPRIFIPSSSQWATNPF